VIDMVEKSKTPSSWSPIILKDSGGFPIMAPLKAAANNDGNELYIIADGFDGELMSINLELGPYPCHLSIAGTFIDIKLSLLPEPIAFFGQAFLFLHPASI
jgi:hypothetical protein